jgi:hypothetical protein
LPVIVDPSHAAGKRELIRPLSRAAIACGADGLVIEAHIEPDKSYSDAGQAITPAHLGEIVLDVAAIADTLRMLDGANFGTPDLANAAELAGNRLDQEAVNLMSEAEQIFSGCRQS